MRYTRIKALSWKQNSDQNVLLRQQWALIYIGLLRSHKIILNIDESWIDYSDYRRMKWSERNVSISVPKKQMTPRISLILGVDTLGNLYSSLT